jgi:hypothetical protein
MAGGFLKNLFIQEEDDATTQKASPAQQAPVSTPVTISGVETSSVPVDTTKTKALLRDALEQEGGKDFDYTKFKKSLEAMKAIIPDEKTRFVSSYLTAKTLGLSKEKLLKTAENSLKTLDGEAAKFNEMVASKLKETVGAGLDKVKLVTDSITQKTLDLQKLTEEITELQKKKTEMEMQISKDQNKMDSLKRDFDLSYQEISNEVKSDITKITTYLEV